MFLQSFRWKWKKPSTRDFFKLSKKNLLHRCFHSAATFCRWFSGVQREENSSITRNSSKSDILMLLKLGYHRGDEVHRPTSSPAIDLVRTIKSLSSNLHRQRWVWRWKSKDFDIHGLSSPPNHVSFLLCTKRCKG